MGTAPSTIWSEKMPTQYVANADIHYQSPTTGENLHFEAGDVIPEKCIADWPGNALRNQMQRGRISTQVVQESKRGKPSPKEASSPTEVSVADAKQAIKDGLWTVEEVVEAEKARPEEEQRDTILALAPEEPEEETDDTDEGDDE